MKNANNLKKVIVFLGAAAVICGGPIAARVKRAGARAEKRAEKRELAGFQNYILENANGAALRGLDSTTANFYAEYDNWQLEWWMAKHQDDSTLYADALKRDAHLIYDKDLGYEASLAKIQNAPVYTRGPGTEYDANGNPVYNENSVKGVNRLHNMEVNYDNYKNSIRQLNKIRAELSHR